MKRFLALLTVFSAFAVVSAPSHGQDEKPSAVPAEILNHLTLNQWVRPSEDGVLTGRVVLPTKAGQVEALGNVTVAIAAGGGEVLRATTDAKGEFSIPNVEPGVYALTARGDNVFACCAMHVIDSTFGSEIEFPAEAQISLANIDYTVVNTAVIRYMPPGAKSLDANFASTNFDSLKDRIRGDSLFRVAQHEGGMKGRIHLAGARETDLADAQLTNVFLFKGGREIERAVTSESGNFAFESVEAGNYSLLAIGPGGIGLLGFELVDQSALAATAQNQAAADGTQLVGLFGHHNHSNACNCCCQEFSMQVAPMPEVVTCVEEVIISETIVEEPCCGGGIDGQIVEGEVVMDGFGAPLPGAGFDPLGGYGGGGPGFSGGGGGFSGGGGGGFGGGIGGLGALAGLGAVAAIAATSDDDNNAITAPIVASPSSPTN